MASAAPAGVLEKHVLLTSQTPEKASKHAAFDFSSNGAKKDASVVYAIHAAPNVVKTDMGIFAVGGALWRQILGWVEERRTQASSEPSNESNEVSGESYLFINEDYNPGFDQYTVVEQHSDDLDSMEKLSESMYRNGQAVGGAGTFPLRQAPADEVKTPSPAPSKPAFLHQTWRWVKDHALALASLPAVIFLNLVPEVGEVADAAEFTAFGAEAVDAAGVAVDGRGPDAPAARVAGAGVATVGRRLAQRRP